MAFWNRGGIGKEEHIYDPEFVKNEEEEHTYDPEFVKDEEFEDPIFKKSIPDIINHILEVDNSGPFLNRRIVVTPEGKKEIIVFKGGNLYIKRAIIGNAHEIGVAAEQKKEGPDNKGPIDYDLRNRNIKLNKLEDKPIEVGNIEADIAEVTIINGEITTIKLIGNIFDNDSVNSIAGSVFVGKLKYILKKTEEGYVGEIECWNYDEDEAFRKAAEMSGLNEEDARKACFSSITIKDLVFYLGDKKYDNDTFVQYLNANMDEPVKDIYIENLGTLNGSINLGDKIEDKSITGKLKIGYIIFGVSLGVMLTLGLIEIKDNLANKASISAPGDLELKGTTPENGKDLPVINSLNKDKLSIGTTIIKQGEGLANAIERSAKEKGINGRIVNLWSFLKNFKGFDIKNIKQGQMIDFYLKKGSNDSEWTLYKLDNKGII